MKMNAISHQQANHNVKQTLDATNAMKVIHHESVAVNSPHKTENVKGIENSFNPLKGQRIDVKA